MMGTYSYTVSRFVPNQIRNEAVNIGIIVVDTDTGKTAHRFLGDMKRLKARCPGANIQALEGIVRSIRVGDMPGGMADLERLSVNHTHSLQFTPPRAAAAPTIKEALRIVFDTYVGEAAVPAAKPACATPKEQMLAEIDAAVSQSGMTKGAAIARPEFRGSRGVFRPDRAFRTRGGAIALHALPFAARPDLALKNAKVLAIDYEDARKQDANLECAAVVDPAPDGGNREGREAYEQAEGHLRDKGCEVVEAGRMPAYARGIARRAGRAGGGGRPRATAAS